MKLIREACLKFKKNKNLDRIETRMSTNGKRSTSYKVKHCSP